MDRFSQCLLQLKHFTVLTMSGTDGGLTYFSTLLYDADAEFFACLCALLLQPDGCR